MLVGAGLILRTLFVSLHDRPLISDEREYDLLAFNLASKGSYTYGVAPTAYRPIGYPAFASLVYHVVGHHPVSVKFIQVLLDALIALLLYHLFSGSGARAQMIAATLWLFYPPAILYTNFLMSETLFTFVLVLVFLLLRRVEENGRCTNLLLGLLLGNLLLIKATFGLFLVMLIWIAARQKWPRKIVAMAVFGVLIAVSPWLFRNYFTMESFSLSSNGGINLLIGNNPNSTGAYAVNFPPNILEDATGEFDADRRAATSAAGYIIEHPVQFAINGIKKIAHLISSEGGLLVWSFHPSPEDTTVRYGAKYASIPLSLTAIVNLPYFLVLLGGIIGLLIFPRDRLWWLILALLASWLATHFIVFGGSRFHFPLMPFMAGFAAHLVSHVNESMREYSRMRVMAAFVLLACCILVWIVEALTVLDA